MLRSAKRSWESGSNSGALVKKRRLGVAAGWAALIDAGSACMVTAYWGFRLHRY
jgi:hypothetical protein